MTSLTYEPPKSLSPAEIVELSDRTLGQDDIPIRTTEEVVTIESLGLDWDMACKVHRPEDENRVPYGPDGKRIGLFMLHGGASDYRRFDTFGPMLARKFGYHVVCMTFPGRLNFDDPTHDWPGETIHPDGTLRTPQWKRGLRIAPDQYELVTQVPDAKTRAWRGTFFLAHAKEGTEFYHRMAAWPIAFEEGMQAVCARFFPPGMYSVYAHGHSTGGPFAHMLLQRLPNAVGLVGMESSPFGAIYSAMVNEVVAPPFNDLMLRTWRNIARYRGNEAGPEAYRMLPLLMEQVLDEWERCKTQPMFKAEFIVHFGAVDRLADAARAAASRMGYDADETDALVTRYRDLVRPLTGPGVKPLPPIIYGITANSVDHRPERYRETVVPSLIDLQPERRVRVVEYQIGTHNYGAPSEGLPHGVGAAAARIWADAIDGGYYVSSATRG